MKINETMTLADVVKEYPQAIPYLNEMHLDYCCGGHDQIGNLACNTSINKEELLKKLNEIAERPLTSNVNTAEDIERFKALPVIDRLQDLEETHHVLERDLMKQTEMYLNKILIVHYPHHGEMLSELHHLFGTLKIDLEEHFAKEERLTFPVMRENPQPNAEQIALVKELEKEHSNAGDLIKEIQALTDNFTLPDDACATFRETYRLMQQLFEDIFIHIFKENSIVFPDYYEAAV